MDHKCPILALIFPCYNEEDVLPHSFGVIDGVLDALIRDGRISRGSFALYIDDGSKDRTWKLITEKSASRAQGSVRGLKLAGNTGHQNALYAGMMEALKEEVNCSITLDVDLQDDISTVGKMLEYFSQGYDLVYGVRRERTSDTVFKRLTADIFYKIMAGLKVKLIPHHSDYRLCSRRVLEAVAEYKESELFLRALFPSIGFRCATVSYDRLVRQFGETKYPLRKMLSFAWRGITSFSAAPLRLGMILSIAFFVFALFWGSWSLVAHFSGQVVPGWSSLMIVLLLSSSAQLFCISLLGEYLGKMFIECKRRPRYTVEARSWM